MTREPLVAEGPTRPTETSVCASAGMVVEIRLVWTTTTGGIKDESQLPFDVRGASPLVTAST
jgi:hypothetical protein